MTATQILSVSHSEDAHLVTKVAASQIEGWMAGTPRLFSRNTTPEVISTTRAADIVQRPGTGARPWMKALSNLQPASSVVDLTAWSQMVVGGLVGELASRYLPVTPCENSWPLGLLGDAASSFSTWCETADSGVIVAKAIAEAATGIMPEEIGEVYQFVRRPVARSVSAAALNESEKISGDDVLAVTQFLTDDYMVSWLTSTTLGYLGPSEGYPLIVDPAVGGGAFLIAAHRHLVGRLGDVNERRILSRQLLSDGLRGYDLDPFMAEIASFALWLEASRTAGATTVHQPARVTGGGHPVGGSLDGKTMRSLLGGVGGRAVVFLTNPPFLARRLMGQELKGYLETHYPTAGNDLCAAFLQSITDAMRPGDLAGVVHQSTIRHLKTLQPLAEYVSGRQEFLSSVDLGAKAFWGISGEKVRTTLSVMRKRDAATPCLKWSEPTFDLSRLPRSRKISVLGSIRLGELVPVEALPLEQTFRRHFGHQPTISRVAKPMQGSSTGNNSKHVRYSWEVHADDREWRQTSKGGGYARWAGLRRYVVLWGNSGERLKELPGSALRNPQYADSADIVWSDTGSFGLSVRLQAPEDIFIASGPGLRVEEGSKWALAAILNSKLATTWLRFDNPKLTITPSAIGSIPMPQGSWDDPLLDHLGKTCYTRKRAIERYFPDSLYWTQESVVTDPAKSLAENMKDMFFSLLQLELDKLEAEYLAECRVRELFGQGRELRKIANAVAGKVAWELPMKAIPGGLLHELLEAVPTKLRPAARSYQGSGVDGLLELMSLKLGVHPLSVFNELMAHTGVLHHMQRLAVFLIHHEVLGYLGFTSDRTWINSKVSLDEFQGFLETKFDTRPTGLLPRMEAMLEVHRNLFQGRPVVSGRNEEFLLHRVAR